MTTNQFYHQNTISFKLKLHKVAETLNCCYNRLTLCVSLVKFEFDIVLHIVKF